MWWAMWSMSGSPGLWAPSSMAEGSCGPVVDWEEPCCVKSPRGERRSKMAPLLMAMGAAGRDALKEMPLEVQKATSESIMGMERELLDKYAAKHFYAKWNKYQSEASDVFI